jgi:hypothetical protein
MDDDGPIPQTDRTYAGCYAIWQLFQENIVSLVVQVVRIASGILCTIYGVAVRFF